ncbi:hypothetical protein [Tautonia plasticadhaerens]|uniref:Uncharacterized protein n=1 Tax=Tautonia plasticadhaerens TaxID=2527974 RepID=A0A518HFV2_9BACT|nr:hypothetical protein [Tautonia plasticadhaerens]QDV39646.1 hypothetical protein ElP_76180 [Tautonia plasticadhaerens]
MSGQATLSPDRRGSGEDTPGVAGDALGEVRGAVGLLGGAIDRPSVLLATLLAANAVFQPYRGRHHDAILYGFQLTNRASGGRHAADLFLKFGSQDDYSLYSRLVSPLVSALGLDAASFLVYLAGVVAFSWALIRLVGAIVPDWAVASAGLVAVAVAAVPLGGLETFHINENFLTPRLPSVALAMIGLERLLRGRWGLAGAALAASMAVHPLMGFGGVLVALAYVAARVVPPRISAAVGVLGLAATAAILALPGPGARIFGGMDPAWYGEVLSRSRYMVGLAWDPADWLRLLASLSILLAGRRLLSADRRSADLLLAVAVASAAGMLGSLLAGTRPYALLLQGQPFRALWPLELLRLPLAMVLARAWWGRGPRGRLGAVLLVGALTTRAPSPADLALLLAVSTLAAVVLRRAGTRPRDPEWAWKAASAGIATAAAVRMAWMYACLSGMWGAFAALVDLDAIAAIALAPIDPLARGLLVVAAGSGLAATLGTGGGYRAAALAIFLAAQLGGLAISDRQPIGDRDRRREADLRLVSGYLARHPTDRPGVPTVYWPDRLTDLWFELGVDSYSAYYQSAGVAFRRGTAIEARRRADLVAPFEMYELTNQKMITRDDDLEKVARYFRIGEDPDPPTLGDLVRLCGDEGLDLVVARAGYPGWYAAGNGRWYIYDCEFVRGRAAGLVAGGGPRAGGPGRGG